MSNNKGFTLIELILYITLLSLFVIVAISFTWNLIYGREKNSQQQIVQQSARIALSRIGYEIKRAKSINNISPGRIILNTETSTTTIELVGNSLQLTSDGLGPYNLTSNQVRVSNLDFSGSTSLNPDTQNITVHLALQQANTTATGQQTAETELAESFELRGLYNQAKKLNVDLTGATISFNRIENVMLYDEAADDIILDKLTVNWTGGGIGSINEVQIGGGSVEWTGNLLAGSQIDIPDISIGSPDYMVNIDYLSFDASPVGSTIEMNFLLQDGSSTKTTLALQGTVLSPSISPEASVSITPGNSPTFTPTITGVITATSTPIPTTAPTSCLTSCIVSGYANGTCKRSCLSGETYSASGSTFCRSGNNRSCCCN